MDGLRWLWNKPDNLADHHWRRYERIYGLAGDDMILRQRLLAK